MFQAIKELVAFVYGRDLEPSISSRLASSLEGFSARIASSRDSMCSASLSGVSEKDSILITYADTFLSSAKTANADPSNSEFADTIEYPLQTLNKFLTTCVGDTVNSVHILPFFPWTSDYGFSVKDYRTVHPSWGTWSHIHAIGKNYHLMFDLVVNHMSSESEWFQGYLRGDPQYDNFFISADPNLDYSKVTRPRALPLLTKYETSRGSEWIWTTFSADQIDLNFSNPEVLLTMLDILLEYIEHGARFIRLDAIGFLWKELGTTCMHLPQTHAIVQLMRAVFEIVAPNVQIITETNVPHKDNLSYFGTGNNEAQSVYNFSLPPLTAHAIIRQDTSYLREWAASLVLPSKNVRFFNFLASHDGIGVNPVRGILPESEISALCQCVEDRKARISYRNNGDGTQSPYELNCNYCDFLTPLSDPDSLRIKRHLLAHSVMLTLPGIPGLYIHSLIGSRNYYKGVEDTGSFRAINRENLDCKEVLAELSQEGSFRAQVFSGMKRMLEVRSSNPVFDPSVGFLVHNLGNKLFIMERGDRGTGEVVLAVHNMGSERLSVTLPEGLFAKSELLSSMSVMSSVISIDPLSMGWFNCKI